MERKFEKTRSWKRCSCASSKSNWRSISLERGVMLLRLNQELLPEPGRPMARMTAPLGGRGIAGGRGRGVAAGGAAGISPAAVEGADGDTGAGWPAARAWPLF